MGGFGEERDRVGEVAAYRLDKGEGAENGEREDEASRAGLVPVPMRAVIVTGVLVMAAMLMIVMLMMMPVIMMLVVGVTPMIVPVGMAVAVGLGHLRRRSPLAVPAAAICTTRHRASLASGRAPCAEPRRGRRYRPRRCECR